MIGSNLVQRLASMGHEVYVVDNLWRGSLGNLVGALQTGWKSESYFMQYDLHKFDLCLKASLTGPQHR